MSAGTSIEDKAEELLAMLEASQKPTVTEKHKVETKKPIQNTSAVTQDLYLSFEGKGKLEVVLLNAAKASVGKLYVMPSAEPVAAKAQLFVTFRVPAGYYWEPIFAEGTASEATSVTGA